MDPRALKKHVYLIFLHSMLIAYILHKIWQLTNLKTKKDLTRETNNYYQPSFKAKPAKIITKSCELIKKTLEFDLFQVILGPIWLITWELKFSDV